LAIARKRKATKLVGKYIPSKKNQLVERLFERLGFQSQETTVAGPTIWTFDLAQKDPNFLVRIVEHQAEKPDSAQLVE
jgi:predicted enzyme involved in methoxymalonyl-ACP biosynthesis